MFQMIVVFLYKKFVCVHNKKTQAKVKINKRIQDQNNKQMQNKLVWMRTKILKTIQKINLKNKFKSKQNFANHNNIIRKAIVISNKANNYINQANNSRIRNIIKLLSQINIYWGLIITIRLIMGDKKKILYTLQVAAE